MSVIFNFDLFVLSQCCFLYGDDPYGKEGASLFFLFDFFLFDTWKNKKLIQKSKSSWYFHILDKK